MSALEQEVLENFRLLDKKAQQRIRRQIEQESRSEALEPMTMAEWLKWAITFGEQIEKKYGPRRINSVDLLEEARDER